MCRRDHCCKPRSQAPGVAAAALIIGAGVAVAKIGPQVARIVHDVLTVLRIAALTTGIVAAVAMAAWITTRVVRWWLRHRQARRDEADRVTRNWIASLRPARDEPLCPACGGNRQILRADAAGNFEPRACPECRPARLAG